MKKILPTKRAAATHIMRLLVLSIFFFFVQDAARAQVAVTVTNPGNATPALAASYASLAAAVTALDASTAFSGPVILTAASGAETAPAGGYVVNFVGVTSAANNVVISGTPTTTITANAAHVVGALNDAIFKIIGSDFVTIQNFTMQENAANTVNTAASNTRTEWGVALLYATNTNGAQNCTIQNNNISLAVLYQNSFGIYANATHTAAAPATSASATTTAGGNSGLKIYGNAISNVNNGISVVGPLAAADYNNIVDIGGADATTANTLTNFGNTGTFSAYANVSGTVNGILVRNSIAVNISNNSITSSGTTTAGTLTAIFMPTSTVASVGTYSNTFNSNTIALTHGLISGALQGIVVQGSTGTATSTQAIIGNNFTTFNYTAAATGAVTGISTLSVCLTSTIRQNTFTNLSVNSSGSVTFISQSYTAASNATKIVFGNSIVTAFNKTIAGGTVTFVVDNGSTVAGAISNCLNNNFSNVTLVGATAVTGISYTDGGTAPTRTVSGNVLNNITTGAATVNMMNLGYWSGVSTCTNNTVTNIAGQGAITGITIGSLGGGATSLTVSLNTINNLISSGTGGNVTGITCSNASVGILITGNLINTLSSTGSASTTTGITLSASNATAPGTVVSKNKIYDLAGGAAGSIVFGINNTAGSQFTINNNLIGDLRAPAATGLNAIVGINLSATATVNLYYNTVNLAATSSSATTFGTSCVTFSSTATALNSRNNILVNTSVPAQNGLNLAANGIAAGLRRSGGTAATIPANYATTSNNNGYWVNPTSGTLNHCTYVEGTSTITNSMNTFANMKTFMATRDQASVQENVAFISAIGSSADFLKYNLATASQLESGAANIATFTDDYLSTIRQGNGGYLGTGSAPDMGAWELEGTPSDLTGPAITYTVLPNTSCLLDVTLTPVGITDASVVNITAGTRPRLYYKKSTNANNFLDNTSATDGWKFVEATGAGGTPFSFTTDYSKLFGGTPVVAEVIQYFVVAQDMAAIVNVGVNSGIFAAAPTSVALTSAAFPLGGTINSYTLVPSGLTGTKTIGAAGDYTSLTGAAGFFNAVNVNGLSGNLVVDIIDASVTELGTVALNAVSYLGCVPGTTYTITIKPTATSTLTGAVGAGAIIKLNGADNVTIDGSNSGGSDRSLTIENTTVTTSGNAVVWLASPATGNGAINNTVKNCIIQGNTALTTFLGMYIGGSTTVSLSSAGFELNSNNTVSNNLFRKTQHGLALFGWSAGTPDLNNVISNNNFGTAVAGEGFSLGGINADRQTNLVVSGNEIQNIVNATTASNMAGIRLLDFKNGQAFKNNIHDILYTGTSTPKLYGIATTSSSYTTSANPSNALIYNNTISKLNSSGTSGVWNVTGLLASAGYGDKYYHNTVSLTGQLANSASGLATAFANGDGNISTVCTNIDVRNNLFSVTGSNLAVAGNFYAFFTQATTLTGSTLNNNDLYCNGTGVAANNAVRFNAINYATLAAWQAFQTPAGQDANSVFSAPIFVSTTDLHLNMAAAPTQLESGGATIAAVTIDIDGNVRPGPAGSVNGGATAPDLGADEFDGAPAVPIVYTSSTTDQVAGGAYAGVANQQIIRIKIVTTGQINPLTLTSLTLNANGTTDIANINAAPSKVWYTGAAPTFSATTQFGASTTPTVADFVVAGSQALLAGDNYFWLAYDVDAAAPVGNFIDGECTNLTVGTVRIPTVSAPTGNRVIVGPMCGNYNVGASQTFPNFPTITNAFADLNARGISCGVTLTLMDATYPTEAFPLTLNAIVGASSANRITIKPNTATTPLVSGSVASGALIKLNGSDYVIIDGSNVVAGSDRSLTITNTSTTAPTAIQLVSLGSGAGASFVTVKNCNVSTGIGATQGYGIAVGGVSPGSIGADNDDVTLSNNAISVATVGIYAIGFAAISVDGMDNLSVDGNSIVSESGALANVGIQVGNGLTSNVNNNTVSVQTTGSNQPVGIAIETGFTASSVTRNTITKVVTTSAGGYAGRGITIGTGTATSNLLVANNAIAGVNGSNWNSFGNSSAIGIAVGIIGTSSTLTTVAGGINIYQNTVSMTGTMGIGSTTAITAALYVGSGATLLDIRNNIFSNTQVGTNVTQKNYAIYSAVANTAYTDINNNDYEVSNTFNPASALVGFLTSDRATLANLQTATEKDAASLAVANMFVSTTNLHQNFGVTPTQLESTGAVLSVTTDIDGNVRPGPAGSVNGGATAPDMGADEFDGVPAPPMVYSSSTTEQITGSAYVGTANQQIIRVKVFTTGLINPLLLTSLTLNANGTTNIADIDLAPAKVYYTGNSTVFSTATPFGAPITPTVANFVVAGSQTLLTGDNYFWLAYDVAAAAITGNVIDGECTSLTVGTVYTPTVTAPAGNRVILGAMCGNYNVGASQIAPNFTTLTNAFADLNGRGISCAVTLTLMDATYPTESFPLTLNTIIGSSAANRITIKPNTGVSPTVTGSAATAIIKLNGTDYVTIEGSNNPIVNSVDSVLQSSRDLTIINTNTAALSVVIWNAAASSSNGATNNTFKNLKVVGQAPLTTFTGIFSGSGTTVGAVAESPNSFCLMENNSVTKTQYGVAIAGAATFNVSDTVRLNSIGAEVAADRIGFIGAFFSNSQNLRVEKNTIFNIITTANNPIGINIAAGVSASTFTANTVSDITYTGTGGYGGKGITVNTGNAASNLTISNNMISNIKGDGWSSMETDGIVGIRLLGTTGGVNIYHNTVNLGSGDFVGYTTVNGLSSALYLSSGTTALNIRNNIFRSNLNDLTNSTSKSYSIYSNSVNTNFTDINYNDYSVSGAQGVLGAINAVDATTFAALQTATAKDANSVNIAPTFTSATNLRLPAATNLALYDLGTPIATITKDNDSESRATTTPDVGADEFSPVTLNLTAFIEGYTSGGVMTPVLLNSGVVGATSLQADTITVELRNSAAPYALKASFKGVLSTAGLVACSFPSGTVAGSYFIVLQHRNAVETWSDAAKPFNTATTAFDFSSGAAQAFGSNMVQVGAKWCMYSGDFDGSNDGFVDGTDYPVWELDYVNFASGYFISDLNGDGFVDGSDYPIWEFNYVNFVGVAKP